MRRPLKPFRSLFNALCWVETHASGPVSILYRVGQRSVKYETIDSLENYGSRVGQKNL